MQGSDGGDGDDTDDKDGWILVDNPAAKIRMLRRLGAAAELTAKLAEARLQR